MNFSTPSIEWAKRHGQKFCQEHHFYYKTVCLRCEAEKNADDADKYGEPFASMKDATESEDINF